MILLGGICRSSERRVSCLCGWWSEVGGEEVEGVWFPEVVGFVCEECGCLVVCSDENSEEC